MRVGAVESQTVRRNARPRMLNRYMLCIALLITVSLRSGQTTADAQTAPTTYQGLTPARLLDTRSTGPLTAGTTIDLQVTGVGGVPSTGVVAVMLNVTAADATSSGFVTVFPTGVPRPEASNLNLVAGDTRPNAVLATVGANGKVSIFHDSGSNQLIVDVNGWFPVNSGYTGLTPTRILDTRTPSRPVGPDGTIDLRVLGVGGVPATGVSAVVLNVTANDPTAPTFVTVFPTGIARPDSSNLNVASGETAPNLVVANVGANGQISLYNSAGTVNLLVDVTGWFATGTSINSLSPQRILDTRRGTKLTANTKLDLQVTGAGGVPTSGVGSVVFNVTAVSPTATTYVTVWPTGVNRPDASSLNVVAGQVRPNAVIATIGAGGKVSLYNFDGDVDVLVDVAGWFPGVTPPSPPPPPAELARTGELFFSAPAGLSKWKLSDRTLTPFYNAAPATFYNINLPQNEFVYFNGTRQVTIRDLTTLAVKSTFSWPRAANGALPNELRSIPEPSPDGRYVIAKLLALGGTGGGTISSVVVDRVGNPVLYLSDVYYDWAWEPNGDLLLASNSTGSVNGVDAKIVRVPKAQLTTASPQVQTVKSFVGPSPTSMQVSADGTKLAYQYDGDLWVAPLVNNFVGRQITYGLDNVSNFAFSPDGSQIAMILLNQTDIFGAKQGDVHVVATDVATPTQVKTSGPTQVNQNDGRPKLVYFGLAWR